MRDRAARALLDLPLHDPGGTMSRKIVSLASFTLLALSITSLAACGGDDDSG